MTISKVRARRNFGWYGGKNRDETRCKNRSDVVRHFDYYVSDDVGNSYRTGDPVIREIFNRLTTTVTLAFATLVFMTIIFYFTISVI